MQRIDRLHCILSQLQAPTAAELRGALQELGCTRADLQPYVTEPDGGRSYGRNVLFQSAEVEAIVIHLPAGAETTIHDHGESVGCALVMEGQLLNAMYRAVGYGMASEAGDTVVETGESMVAPHGQIHQMRNASDVRMISLHLYAPPLAGMRQYIAADKAVLDFVI